MASIIRKEFSGDNPLTKTKYNIGPIKPISMKELHEALTIIKTNKATSLDCTTDYIVKVISQYSAE